MYTLNEQYENNKLCISWLISCVVSPAKILKYKKIYLTICFAKKYGYKINK